SLRHTASRHARTTSWWPRRPLATLGRKPRQGRKAATVSIDAGAEASWRGYRLLDPAAPVGVVGGAQAGEVAQHLGLVARAPLLQQRAPQALQVALAPAGRRDPQLALVEVDQPALAAVVEQQVVRV